METIKGDALLIRFKSEDIIDSLQSGCIYMNSIKKFRDIEKDGDDKVGDYPARQCLYVQLTHKELQEP